MTHPFEVAGSDLASRLNELVDVTFGDLQSQFLVLPRGPGFIDFADFQQAYEALKVETRGFTEFTIDRVWSALAQDALVLVVVRTILGFSPPEWADVAGSQTGTVLPQGAARTLDRRVRLEREMFAGSSIEQTATGRRARVLLEVAVLLLRDGAPTQPQGMTHRRQRQISGRTPKAKLELPS